MRHLWNHDPMITRWWIHGYEYVSLCENLFYAIGYEKASKLVFKAFKENKTLKQVAVELNLLDEKTFNEIVNPKKMLKPYG